MEETEKGNSVVFTKIWSKQRDGYDVDDDGVDESYVTLLTITVLALYRPKVYRQIE